VQLDGYLAELTRRLRDVLGDELLGVYAGGSYALGAYEPGRSEVPLGSDVVLNTCRALRFAAEGTWSSKREAGALAAGEPTVRAALAGDELDREAVRRFLDAAETRLDDALGQA
jgi:hypothetical protein